MKISKAIVTSTLVLACFLVAVLAQTQGEMNQEACDDYKKADAELNKVYQQVLTEYRADTLFVSKMKNAQRAWVAYRDAHLESVFPAADPREYGSVYPMCRCTALTEITKKRTAELRRWVVGVKEGDVCAGSVKMRG